MVARMAVEPASPACIGMSVSAFRWNGGVRPGETSSAARTARATFRKSPSRRARSAAVSMA